MKIVLAGSPQISIAAFEKVINNFDVVAIVTQPDRKQGRGMKLQETAVASLGSKYGIKVFKEEKIGSITEELKKLKFDLLLTFAFGQWIPTKILELGKFKPVNIHGSLLPKYRGAAPIHHAILNGDKKIGITLIEMIKEMDAGDMFFKASQYIDAYTTTGDGFEIISKLAEENICDWLTKIENGESNPTVQSSDFTIAPKIDKSFSKLEETLNVEEVKRKIVGLNPFPGAFLFVNDKRLKVFQVSDQKTNGSIELKFKNGIVFANDFQWEGKRRTKI